MPNNVDFENCALSKGRSIGVSMNELAYKRKSLLGW